MQQLPLFIPDSDWRVPRHLPRISGKIVGLDSETNDQSLSSNKGPGWPYRAGYICGVSAAWDDQAIYAPVRHPDTENLPSGEVGEWVDYILRNNHIVFQNGPYDMGWFWAEWGLKPPERMDDTVLMAQTLDENRLSYSLENICKWLGIKGKDETKLREAAVVFGIKPNEVKKHLWRMPAQFVGPYAEQDARSTLGASGIMRQRIEDNGLTGSYELDRDLLPMVVEMRRRGIRIDTGRAEMLAQQFEEVRDNQLRWLTDKVPVGRAITINDVQSPRFLERIFAAESIPFPRTAKSGQGSFQSDWMAEHSHWLPQAIARIDFNQMMASKFLRGFLLDYSHLGRIHAEIHSYRSDEGGTRSYRFSYSDPPLQQMPSRTKEGKLIRTCFLPDDDNELWLACDYSQQEYRLIVHYACLMNQPRAEEAAELYRTNPKTDFHKLVQEWTDLTRNDAKDTNFAKAFGAGVRKFAAMIGKSETEARIIYEKYDRELPFVSGAAKRANSLASQRGWIKLIDGALCRFDLFEPAWREDGEPWSPACDETTARAKWPGRKLKRAFTHKAFNRLIQGSAARQTKMAMRECWRRGIVPLIQMHDELGVSVPSEEMVNEVRDIMVNVVSLQVPVMAEPKVGLNWGDTSKRRPGSVARLFRNRERRLAA